jgi:hypothetical protein
MSRAGLCARRFQILSYFRIWSAQPATSSAESRPTLLIRVVPDTRHLFRPETFLNLTPETYLSLKSTSPEIASALPEYPPAPALHPRLHL